MLPRPLQLHHQDSVQFISILQEVEEANILEVAAVGQEGMAQQGQLEEQVEQVEVADISSDEKTRSKFYPLFSALAEGKSNGFKCL